MAEAACSLHEVEVQMVTWNIGSSSSSKHYAELRNNVVSTVRQQLSQDCLFFLQEISCGVQDMTNMDFSNFAPITRGKKEAGVSTPDTISKGTCPYGAFQVKQERLMTPGVLPVYGVAKEFADRLYGRMVTISGPFLHVPPYYYYDCKITLLSYHAQYKIKDSILNLVAFFANMCDLADNFEQTIIIGGDFNFNDLKMKIQLQILEESGRLIMPQVSATTPRRWGRCIDTFAIVHPLLHEHRTKCQFGTTLPIYPFPMITISTGREDSKLQSYPPHSAHPWFKYLDYHGELSGQRQAIEDTLKEMQFYWDSKKRKLLCCGVEPVRLNGEPCIQERVELTSTPYVEAYKESTHKYPDIPPPLPLWPHSPLEKVLDHDPVLTTLKITLKPREDPLHKLVRSLQIK